MNIAVLMWYDDNIKSYADNFYKINTKYCEKHGYTIIKSSERTYTDRKPTWERFPLVLEYIESYDYVMWIDADAHFYLDAPSLENIINKYNKDIILSKDIENINDTPPNINAGVFILKNTQQVIDIVNKWAYSDELKEKSKDAYPGRWIEDQAIIRWFVKHNIDNINDITVVLPYKEIQHFLEEELKENIVPYVHHFAGTSTKDRKLESKKYLKTISNNNTGLIPGIIVGSLVLMLILYYIIYRN